jgi:hypothetical protein
MITPLKKHHGHNSGWIALGLLAVTGIAVWKTQPGADRAPATATTASAAASSAPRPAEPAPTLTRSADGVPTIVVGEREVRTHLAAEGFAAYDERKTGRVVAPVSGFFTTTRKTWLGRGVRAGEQLGTIHSLEVYLATLEVLRELREFRGQEPLDQARFRLLRWGMPYATLAKIEKTRQPTAALPVIARVSGAVVAEQLESTSAGRTPRGTPPRLVDAGREILVITDPARACIFVELPDADGARVRVGTPTTLRVTGLARPLTAKVAYVWSRAEQGMRRLRIDVTTPQRIQPGASVTAELTLERDRVLVVPRASLLREGERSLVFVQRGSELVLQDVVVAPLTTHQDGTSLFRVVSGLAAGDTVAAAQTP